MDRRVIIIQAGCPNDRPWARIYPPVGASLPSPLWCPELTRTHVGRRDHNNANTVELDALILHAAAFRRIADFVHELLRAHPQFSSRSTALLPSTATAQWNTLVVPHEKRPHSRSSRMAFFLAGWPTALTRILRLHRQFVSIKCAHYRENEAGCKVGLSLVPVE